MAEKKVAAEAVAAETAAKKAAAAKAAAAEQAAEPTKEETLRALLAELSLSQFADKIISEGCNSVQMLSEMDADELARSAGRNRIPPAVPSALRPRRPLAAPAVPTAVSLHRQSWRPDMAA